jgi:hypothetical protein
MSLHTSRPEEFMNQVERNLITPAMLLESAKPRQQPMFASTMTAANFTQTPLSAPTFGSFPWLTNHSTSLSPLDLASATNLLSAAALYSPLTAPTTPQLSDFAALQSLSSNPLLAFGLCSLLDMQKSNLFKFQHVA